MNSIEMEAPLALFNFRVEFDSFLLSDAKEKSSPDICYGSFSECTGLEATMEPKVIKAGGFNYGPAQRVGPVTFSTVILKRGITSNRDLWKAFSLVTVQGSLARRFNVAITALHPPAKGKDKDAERSTLYTARLSRALPVKLKCGDFNARATEITIEELHLAHEGLSLEFTDSHPGKLKPEG